MTRADPASRSLCCLSGTHPLNSLVLRWTERGLYCFHESLVYNFLPSGSKELVSGATKLSSLYLVSQIPSSFPSLEGQVAPGSWTSRSETNTIFLFVGQWCGMALGCWFWCPVQSDDTGQSLLARVLSMISILSLACWEAAPRGCGELPFLPYGLLVFSVPGPCWE